MDKKQLITSWTSSASKSGYSNFEGYFNIAKHGIFPVWLIPQKKHESFNIDVSLDKKVPIKFRKLPDPEFGSGLRIRTGFASTKVCAPRVFSSLLFVIIFTAQFSTRTDGDRSITECKNYGDDQSENVATTRRRAPRHTAVTTQQMRDGEVGRQSESESATADRTTRPCRRRWPGASSSSRRYQEAEAAVSHETRTSGSRWSRRRRCWHSERGRRAAWRRPRASSDRSSTAARWRRTVDVGSVDCARTYYFFLYAIAITV